MLAKRAQLSRSLDLKTDRNNGRGVNGGVGWGSGKAAHEGLSNTGKGEAHDGENIMEHGLSARERKRVLSGWSFGKAHKGESWKTHALSWSA